MESPQTAEINKTELDKYLDSASGFMIDSIIFKCVTKLNSITNDEIFESTTTIYYVINFHYGNEMLFYKPHRIYFYLMS